VDYLTTAIIVPIYEENDAQYLQDLIQNVHEMVVAETKVAPSWGISKACEEALEIWKAYEEAKKALLAAAKEKQISIMSYSDLIEDSTSYYYTPSFTQRIRNYTKTGDIQNIEHLVEMLYIENAQKRHLDKIVIGKLHENIKATIMQLIHTEEMSEEAELRLDDLEKIAKEDMRAYFNELKKVFIQISNLYNRAKQSNQSRLITKIMDYINETYKDSSLGLGMVAAQFNISEGYISTLFKDQANINFTEYVEGLRITRACDLLENTETTISDIATQVGYNSVQSFRRAFKRIHGVSPSELRKKE
jgi:YesN/AraC family two-component response regulator